VSTCPLVQLMPHGPGMILPSVDEPLRSGISLAGRHQPPPFLIVEGAEPTCCPVRQTFGPPADSVMCSVFEVPSVMSAIRTLVVLDTTPSPTPSTRPSCNSRGSTP